MVLAAAQSACTGLQLAEETDLHFAMGTTRKNPGLLWGGKTAPPVAPYGAFLRAFSFIPRQAGEAADAQQKHTWAVLGRCRRS